MKEILFLVYEAEEGGYWAKSSGQENIYAQGETIDELKDSIKGGIDCFFDKPESMPKLAHLHFVKDEVLAL
jgi:predicted RNase H-like HicB family nuclease